MVIRTWYLAAKAWYPFIAHRYEHLRQRRI